MIDAYVKSIPFWNVQCPIGRTILDIVFRAPAFRGTRRRVPLDRALVFF